VILCYRFRQLSSLGLIALTGFAVFVFGAVDAFAATIMQVTLAALALAWAIRKLQHPYPFVTSVFYLPLLVIVGAAGVQTLFSLSASAQATKSELGLWLAYLAFLVIAVNVQADPVIRRTWPVAGCWLGIWAGSMAMLQALVAGGSVFWRSAPGIQPFGPFANFERFAVFAELLFPILLLTALEKSRRRALGIVAAAVVAATAAACGSRTGFLLLTSEFVVILIVEAVALTAARCRNARRILASAGAFGVVAVALVAGGIIGQFAQDETIFPVSDGSAPTAAWQLFQQKKGLGHGLGAFAATHRAEFSTTLEAGSAGAEPVRFMAELGIAGVVAQMLLIGLLPIMARSRRSWLGGAMALAAAWSHSWNYAWLESPALVLIALGLLALVATDGMRLPVKAIFRRRNISDTATHTHQNQSPQRAYQVSSVE
jgi:hypothetical protein